jgi:hypothetical protein
MTGYAIAAVYQPDARESMPSTHANWLFEIKHDGFRSTAFIEDGHCRLISRNGYRFAASVILRSRLPNPCAWQEVASRCSQREVADPSEDAVL